MTLKAPIAVTMGDPSGIGPEIALKVLTSLDIPIKIYGNTKILELTARRLKIVVPQNRIVNTIDLTTDEINEIKYSNPSKTTGKIAYSAIKSAVDDCLKNKVSAIVTCPISKLALNLAGHEWPGHTELLAHLTNKKAPPKIRMVLLSEKFLIVLNSIHLSLKDAILQVNINNITDTIEIINKWTIQNNINVKNFWMAALNPHSGEGGLLGSEETSIIQPAIKIAKSNSIPISGPWPADTLFMKIKASNNDFPPRDVIISLYHDQALIPFKLDGLNNGVNLTAGLPFLRTSVDHGTAFDIAGKGIASSTPLKNAILITNKLITNTSSYDQ